jgi:hypothetical protein
VSPCARRYDHLRVGSLVLRRQVKLHFRDALGREHTFKGFVRDFNRLFVLLLDYEIIFQSLVLLQNKT